MTRNLLLILLFSTIFAVHSHAQIHINKYVLDTFGTPIGKYEWADRKTDSEDYLITVGNTTTTSGNTKVLIAKHDVDGQLSWQKEHEPEENTDSENYGITLAIDDNDDIFIAAASRLDSGYAFYLLKLNASGVLQWDTLYEASSVGDAVPTAVIVGDSGDVYFTGYTTTASDGKDFLTLKADGNTGEFLWEETFDNAGLHDIPVAIEINNDNVTVTGSSGAAINNIDYAVVEYNAITSVAIDTTINDSVPASIDIPTAVAKDGEGNIYVTGNSGLGNNQNIKTIKVDSTLNVEWEVAYDTSVTRAEVAHSMVVDNNGNIYVAGAATNSHGRQELLLLKYDEKGTLEWQRRRRPLKGETGVIGLKSTLDSDGNISVTGSVFLEDNNSQILTLSYAPQGYKLWEDIQDSDNISNDRPLGINAIGDEIYVLAVREETNRHNYYHIRYKKYARENPVRIDTTTDEPFLKEAEVIVKFDDDYLHISSVNNLDITHAPLEYFLKDTAITLLAEKIDTNRVTLIRIFKQLKTTYTTCNSRLNETIPVPDFWAAFVMVFPVGTSLEASIDSLESAWPVVKYAHPNFITSSSTGAVDAEYLSQHSLNSTEHPQGHINIEPAWDIETGKSFIRCGVMDGGMDYTHEDFGIDTDGDGTPDSTTIQGWDMQSGSPITSVSINNFGQHGTNTGGIIGAGRNNSLHIAGIAGGAWDTTQLYNQMEPGVSIYSMRILNFKGNLWSITLDYVADAIVTSALDDDSLKYGYGLHLSNNSWKFAENTDSLFTDNNIQLISDATHFANRNKVIFCAARGNTGNTISTLPATYDDDWVISVGAIDEDAKRAPFSSFGKDMDLMAPGVTKTVLTLKKGGGTVEFSGTSAACPHVTGVAALMLSHVNDPAPNYDNLAPEDVEFVLQYTAIDITIPSPPYGLGYDEESAYGRLDAGAALQQIDSPYRIAHFGTDVSSHSIAASLYDSDVSISLIEPYDNIYGDSFPPDVVFEADIFEINATVTHTLNVNEVIDTFWPRHSSSTTFALESGGKLVPHEKIEITNISDTSATLRGYAYLFKNTAGDTIGWLPFDIADIDTAELTYSLLLEDQTIVSTQEVSTSSITSYMYPNPANSEIVLYLYIPYRTDVDINLYDIQGRFVKNVYFDNYSQKLSLPIDIEHLVSGMYFLKIQTSGESAFQKFIKQ